MTRQQHWQALSFAAGVFAAASLHSALSVKAPVFPVFVAPPAPSVPVRVSAANKAAPARVALKPSALPLPVDKPTARKLSEATGSTAPAKTELPTLAQPNQPEAPTAPPSALPKIARQDAPPSPGEPVVQDVSGGDVVVVALLVNDQGRVVDSKFLVTSRNPLSDLSLLYASRDQKWSGLVPPLLPGEQRWIEHRVDYSTTQSLASSPLIP